MTNTNIFDVLVVYTETIASSASSNNKFPFDLGSNYNNAYEYFLKLCQKNNLNAAFTTTKDLRMDASFESHWLFDKKWIKVEKSCSSELIFDKFSSKNTMLGLKRKTLFADTHIGSFNDPDLLALFRDKQKTFEKFQKYMIPTVTVGNNSKSISFALAKLENLIKLHPNKKDFSDKIIIKDRFGAGGNNIYKIGLPEMKANILKILSRDRDISFVLQPFTKFNKGYSYRENQGFTDIRIIYLGGKIIQAYVRIASPKNFRCNEHVGGKLIYIPIKEIPIKVMRMAKEIVGEINSKYGLVALDFVISNNGAVFLMEGNSQPGLDWNLSLKKNEREAKKLIRVIVEELKRRIIFENPSSEARIQFPVFIPTLAQKPAVFA